MRRESQIALPIEIEKIIPSDDEVITLDEICNEMNFSRLRSLCVHKQYDCETMFKIVVYGYMNGIYSSREIEKACRRDVNFMWLLDGMSKYDNATIARFTSEILPYEIKNLFAQMIDILAKRKELGLSNIFIDGTKIEAYANKYSFVWKGTVEKNSKKLEEKVKEFILNFNNRYSTAFEAIEGIYEYLENQNISFVHGKGKRKTQLQKDYEAVKDILEKKYKYEEYNSLFKGRNSFSKTDTDATFMRMKEDHMKNGQLKAGYNIQIGVDSEYIVNTKIYPNATDQLTLIDFLKDTEENIHIKYEEIVADAGYESEENYKFLDENNQTSYIKPTNYETSKKKCKRPYDKRNFKYIEESDCFICPSGEELSFQYSKVVTSKSGYESEKNVYYTEKCLSCPNRDKCTTAESGIREVQRSSLFEKYRNQSTENITTENGIILRMNRSIQVEGAFGVIKENYKFRRFLTRGRKNVETQFLLLAFAFDINKYNHKTKENRNQTHLFKNEEKMIA